MAHMWPVDCQFVTAGSVDGSSQVTFSQFLLELFVESEESILSGELFVTIPAKGHKSTGFTGWRDSLFDKMLAT